MRRKRIEPLADVLEDICGALTLLKRGELVSERALAARERLQAVLFESVDAFDSRRGLFASHERVLQDRRLLDATQRPGYATLSLFWVLGDVRLARETISPTLFGLRQLRVQLAEPEEGLLISQIEAANRHLCGVVGLIWHPAKRGRDVRDQG